MTITTVIAIGEYLLKDALNCIWECTVFVSAQSDFTEIGV